MKRVIACLLLCGGFLFATAHAWPWNRGPSASISADPATIVTGGTATLTWSTANADSVTLDGEAVEASGTKEVSPTATTTYTLAATGRRRAASDSATITVSDTPTPEPTPTPAPTPTPTPVDGFTLSAVGIGSAFGVGDTLSLAARDHDLGAFILSQNGTWTTITDEVMAPDHPKAFDEWVAIIGTKAKPAVIWHNQGKVLAIDAVTEATTGADLLALAKSHVPTVAGQIIVDGKVRLLGLIPEKPGARFAGPRLSKILNPIAAADCPTVDLASQNLWRKDQTGGTCVLNAFASACEAATYVAYGKTNSLQFSPYFLANLTSGYNGTYASSGAEMVQKYGNLPFKDMAPYDRLPVGWKAKAANYKCLAVYGPPESSDTKGYIRAALRRGYVVCAGIGVGNGFDVDSTGYISYARGGSRSVNHEILVVGWDQAKSRFKILNSWGRSWGNDGFAWLEDRFFDYDNDLWTVVAMTAAPSYKFYSPVMDTVVVPVTAVVAPPSAAPTHADSAKPAVVPTVVGGKLGGSPAEKPKAAAVGGCENGKCPVRPAESAPLASPCENGQCPSGNCGGGRRGLFGRL
jgi:hypothetical protein